MKDLIFGKPGGKTLWQHITADKAERLDLDFPHGIRLPSRILMDITNFYTVEPHVEWADLMVGAEVTAKRAYAYIGETLDYAFLIEDDNGNEAKLLCEAGSTNPTLFVQIDEVYPETGEEWDEWLSMKTGIMTGLELEDPNGVKYTRCWGSGRHVAPIRCREEVILSATEKGKEQYSLDQMMFYRDIAGTKEYLLFTVRNKEMVEIWAGCEVILNKVLN